MIAILTLLLLLLGRAKSTATCYYPSGNVSTHDVPCSSSGDGSFCCAPGWACLNEKICMSTPLAKGWNGTVEYLRGSCTDPVWHMDLCPTFCLYGAYNTSQSMTNCNSPGNITFCCDNVKECDCSDGDTAEVFNDFEIIETTIGFPSSTASTKTSSSLFTSIIHSPTTSAVASLTFTTSTTASSSSSPVPAPNHSTNYSLDIGAGLGIPAGIFALAGIAYLLHRHQRKKKKLAAPKSQDLGSPKPYDPESPPAYENEVHEKPDDAVYREVPTEMPADTYMHESDSGQIHELA